MRSAYGTKIANALRGLSGAEGALAAIKTKRALVQYWTVHNAGEGANELDNILGEMAVCCDHIAKDIAAIKG